jgi:hypothetical protein
MRAVPKALKDRLRGEDPYADLHSIKKRAIDAGFERIGARSFADLGGVWAVEGGYTFYAADTHRVERAALVDAEPTPAVIERAGATPNVSLVRGNFGSEEVAAQVGEVDAVLMFDVLLHQVAPDWDDVLRIYAPRTRSFVIVDPQYVEAERTVRLLDLGADEYERITPPQPAYDAVRDRLDEPAPYGSRPNRDVHNIWQWGIVEADLRALMDELGFALVFYENAGVWQGLPAFENHAFVFIRP